jgi:uroporphyrinogen-III decarboxylase
MDLMLAKFLDCYNLYTKTEIEAILIPEDASTTIYSPKIFDNYIKPVLKKYCDIIKSFDKIAIIHACGHLKNLTKSLSEAGADCIESISPPPTGNINISEFKKAMPGVCVMGGIPANVFLLELDKFKEYVKNLIIENKIGGNFILSSGDSVPSNAKVENIKSISELVNKYGQY